MLNKRIINTGGAGAACTTDTTQILDAGTTESIALYRFEDNAFDTSNSTGYINKGAVFNGSNSQISLTAGSFSYTGEFSIAAWIKLSSSQSSQVILENYDYTSSTSRGFVFRVMTGEKLKFDGYYSDATRTDARSNESIPLGVWTHVAAVYNPTNSSVKLYINGSEVTYHTQTYNTMQYHSSCPVNIGCLSYTGAASEQFFHGNIDELRVYGDALTATEVGYIANNTTASIPTGNLNALYSFEGNANDSTSYPINGTASNVVYDYDGSANNITYSTGKFGKAAVFNGSSTGIEIPGLSTMFGQKTSYTVSAWFKAPSSATGNRAIFDDYNYANSNLGLYLYDGVMNFFARYNNSNTSGIYSGTVTYNDNNWHHVVATSDQTTGKLYVDGQLISSGAMPSPSYSGGSPVVSIGKQQHPGSSTYSWFDGSIDQYRIFDHAITAAQVTALYNETATSVASGTIDNPSTIAYYKMADGSDETGSYNGTPTNVDFNVEGKYGFAAKFASSSSYLTVPAWGQSQSSDADFSLSFWIKFESLPTTGSGFVDVINDSSGPAPMQLYIYGVSGGGHSISLQRFLGPYYYNSGYNSTAAKYNNFQTGQWYHIAISYVASGKNVSVYVNGTQSGSTYSLDTATTSYSAGSTNVYVKNQRGFLDQFRVFNKAISAAEVTALYNEVQCANTITAPEDYFDTKLYTGTGASQNITGLNFAPAFVWIKDRSAANWHNLQDTIRGATKHVYSNATNAQDTTSDGLTAFNSDGFTIGGGGGFGNNGNNFASWNWKAASSDTTNNDGTITSTVRASQESGFSIVKATFNTSSPQKIGHGLASAPEFIISKRTSTTSDWNCYHKFIDASAPEDYFIKLNSTDGRSDNSIYWNDTAPTSSVFTTGSIYDQNETVIFYCFHSIDGYQRIGSYVGNATNTKIYTGFEPAWLLIKSLSSTNTWWIVDNKRDTANPRKQVLRPSSSSAETTETTNVIFHTNGFELPNGNSDTNENNFEYLFLAIAANPDTTAPTKANSFKTKIYTGTGNTHAITGLGFKPDFIWTKNRDTSDTSALVDSVRGIISPAPYLGSNATAIEATSTNMPTSVQADGYTITGAGGRTNTNGEDYVSWNWKAADHDRNLASINNYGSITSSVSANIAAGFSIVSYKGNASSGATVGHGLGGELDFLIVKSTNLTQAWNVYVKGVTDTNAKYLRLNESNGIYTTVNPRFIPGNFSDNVFSIGSDNACNGNNDDYIAYCFRSIPGYSKVGTYAGSGASGKTVTTGFQPSWVLIKNTTSQAWWNLSDSARGASKSLFPNDSYQEVDDTGGQRAKTFNSTGFTLDGNNNDINGSGQTYIYMAIK